MNCLTAKDVKFNLLQCQAFNRDHCGKRSFGCFQFTEKMLNVELGEGNLIFCHMGSQENYLGWSVCKIVIIIILSVGFGTSKNKIIEVKKIVLIKVTTSLYFVILQCQVH